MHPSSGITKEYVVTLNRQPRPQDLDTIAAGCTMDGVFVQPVAVIRDDTDPTRPNRVRVVVAEGRNREVRWRVFVCVCAGGGWVVGPGVPGCPAARQQASGGMRRASAHSGWNAIIRRRCCLP